MKKIMSILICVFLSACFPAYKTVQPESSFIVVDNKQKPIAGVQVTLVTEMSPSGKVMRNSKLTDASGKAQFESLHRFHWQVPVMHGMALYWWSLCVYKEGYETYFSNLNNDNLNQIIILQSGKADSCRESSFLY